MIFNTFDFEKSIAIFEKTIVNDSLEMEST